MLWSVLEVDGIFVGTFHSFPQFSMDTFTYMKLYATLYASLH